jgi:endonuclease YncB( thermonuclease family)
MLRLAAFLLLVPAVALADVTGAATVIDGNTIEIGGERIRLFGIDAPEMAQICATRRKGNRFNCGVAAAERLRKLTERKTLACKGDARDEQGALLARCFVGRIDINEQMVINGWALAYRRESLDYIRAEQAARATDEGMWKARFVPPWEWREGKRLEE